MMAANIRLDLLDNWLRTPSFGRHFVYHRGELARDVMADPQLAAVAARVRAISTGEFDDTSPCGHVRSHTTGSGEVEVYRRREQGVPVHVVRRRA